MDRILNAAAAATLCIMTSCNQQNPLLTESDAPFGAPRFDLIKTEHYKPAFEKAIAEAKAEIDAIVAEPEEPTFANTIEALEYAGGTLDGVANIFFNLLEAESDEAMRSVAEEVSPMLTEYSMYVSLNDKLFQRVKAVYEKKDSLNLEPDQIKLLEKSYKGFVRGGANLSEEDKELYGKYSEELSLATLKFGNNVLAATNAFALHLTDSSKLAGLPEYMKQMGAEEAASRNLEGWVYTLDYPSYGPFMKYSSDRELRKRLYLAYNSKGVEGDNCNCEVIKQIVDLRTKIASLLGYGTHADYVLEERMAGSRKTVTDFLASLMEQSLPFAREEVAEVTEYAKSNGFEDDTLMPWDFPFWSERYQEVKYSLNQELLKPYFKLENCIDAVIGLAGRLYGLKFEERGDIPAYHKDVKVFDVTDESGRHLALFYADFFPRKGKRGGAWMTEFRGQSIRDGVERRPFISIVTNFTKPTANDPSLITHDELTTFLHEFGHALHGILAEGRYPSITGTNVARDFVELPSQIMENWAFEPEYLSTFAKDYRTGEVIPSEYVERIESAKNYLSGYYQVRQLNFGILDMAWYTCETLPDEDVLTFENKVLSKYLVLPATEGTCISTSFNHIFSGGYSAGYYSYKWAEVLEADAFECFKEKGIFNRDVASSFRENILSKGSSTDEAILYRNFCGHDPDISALMKKLGLI